MADLPNTKPATPPAAPARATIDVLLSRDYWPLGDAPADWQKREDGSSAEYRVRAGEVIALSAEEAMDVCGAGIGTRVKP